LFPRGWFKMFTVHQIQSLDLQELQPYRTMRRQLEHRARGIFVAEGEKVVRRLLESRLPVISLLMPEEWASTFVPLLEGRSERIDLFLAEKKLLETLTGFSMYQGVLGLAKVPESRDLEEILQRSERPWLLAAAEGLTNAENLGALIRNCAAFNVDALITSETCCSPFLRRAVRSSMGTIFQLPLVESECLGTSVSTLKARGVRCIAAHPQAKMRALPDADFTSDCCLIFGSEGQGISSDVLGRCDECVALPMPPLVDSLNVSSAAAVFLYEATRQRGEI
jgi:tRNA G18 (ribose-2'-O)-methylase SpoU